jgi:hypothetical protein
MNVAWVAWSLKENWNDIFELKKHI